jgi:hypothetical protein
MSSVFVSSLLRRLAWPAGLALAAALHACGGGVEGQGTGSASSYSEGPISGFGSIVVNGVHFDESTARITDDEGRVLSADALKLGMTVRIDAGPIDQAAGTALAEAVRVSSDVAGPVSANDLASATMMVLDQPVRVTASTAFDDDLPAGQASVLPGDLVQVYAILDPVSGVYAAQRVERVSGMPSSFRLRGLVADLDEARHTLRVGGALLTYDEGTAPDDLAEGQLMRLALQTARDGSGRWVVTRFDDAAARPEEGSEAEIESVIAAFASNADFTVSGLRVNASGARIEPAGAVLAAGVRVEVEGRITGGVLVATQVEVKGSGDDGGDDEGREIELEGRITSLDTGALTFVLRDELVDYSQAAFSGGDAGSLAVDVKVKVRGHLTADGTAVLAEEIEFED